MKEKKEKFKKVYSNLKMMMNFLVLALKRYRVHIRIQNENLKKGKMLNNKCRHSIRSTVLKSSHENKNGNFK